MTNDPTTLTTIQALISGVIGSAIGALATIWATRKSIEATAKQAREIEKAKNDREERQRVDDTKNWIHAEILQINEIVKEMPRKRKLPMSAWESTKMYFYWWKPEEQKALIELYNEVEMFNTQVDFWMYGQDENIRANHPGQLTASMQRVKPALKKAIDVLEVVLPDKQS